MDRYRTPLRRGEKVERENSPEAGWRECVSASVVERDDQQTSVSVAVSLYITLT